jgi:hypothetical protein
MSYKVYFLGLVCFYRVRGGRLALLPDGTTPPAGVDPHYPSIIVAPEAIEDAQGWGSNASTDTERGIFFLPHCTISMDGMEGTGELDVSQHEGALPQLRQINSNFEIDPERAQTSARLTLRQGTLTAHAIPGGEALISQLVIPHESSFTITVTPTDGSSPRTLRLQGGTEVIVANMGKQGVYPRAGRVEDPEHSHFRIYEKLSVNPVTLTKPSAVAALPKPDSRHWYFLAQRGINLDIECTNTGCC